jgi:DNA-binding MarR family transcriptional regulator
MFLNLRNPRFPWNTRSKIVLQNGDRGKVWEYYIGRRYSAIRYKKIAMDNQLFKYLPLTESTSYILLALNEPLHGYALMQKVETMSQGTVRIGPGTLYGAFSQLEKEGLIDMVREEDRRKAYLLTQKGKLVLQEHLRRVEILVRNGRSIF